MIVRALLVGLKVRFPLVGWIALVVEEEVFPLIVYRRKLVMIGTETENQEIEVMIINQEVQSKDHTAEVTQEKEVEVGVLLLAQ